jgi:hypothetical protein
MSSISDTTADMIANRHEAMFTVKFNETVCVASRLKRGLYGGSNPKPDIMLWKTTVNPHIELVDAKNSGLFLENCAALRQLKLGELWMEGLVNNDESQKIWKKIQSMTTIAAAFVCNKKSEDSKNDSKNDSAIFPGNLDIGSIYKNLPSGLMQKIHRVAENYSSKIESGETSLQNMNLGDISQELFKSIDKKEMEQMVGSFGSMFQAQ